jgi:hypothetical protein
MTRRRKSLFTSSANFPLHTLLFGVYPVLSLLAANIQESPLDLGWRALLLSALLAAALLGLAWLWLRDWPRAGLVASVALAALLIYGQLYNALKLIPGGELVARHRFLAPVWLLAAGAAIWWLATRLRKATEATRVLNVIALLLIVFPAFTIASFAVRNSQAEQAAVELPAAVPAQDLANAPDVYYIIADAYSRDDLMQSFYDFDNTPFLSALRQRGFYVAECSLSNYPKTRLSLTSSLNMNYLEDLGITANEQADEFFRRIRNSAVRKTFEALGYNIVSFETGFYWTEWPDADFFLSHTEGAPSALRLNPFESLFLQTTLFRAVLDLQPLLAQQVVSSVELSPLEEHYEITKFAVESLPDLVRLPGPKFVFAHLLIPHGPFVFAADGSFRPSGPALEEAYVDQVTYLNGHLLTAIDAILAESERPVVIILQGDHGGPGTQLSYDRMKILNAYYMPAAEADFYPQISPVNTFRLLFNHFFNYENALLPDISNYSTSEDFFDTTVIQDNRPGCTSN